MESDWTPLHTLTRERFIKKPAPRTPEELEPTEPEAAKQPKGNGNTACCIYRPELGRIVPFESARALSLAYGGTGEHISVCIRMGTQWSGFDVWRGGPEDRPDSIKKVREKGRSIQADGQWVYFEYNADAAEFLGCKKGTYAITKALRGVGNITGRHPECKLEWREHEIKPIKE